MIKIRSSTITSIHLIKTLNTKIKLVVTKYIEALYRQFLTYLRSHFSELPVLGTSENESFHWRLTENRLYTVQLCQPPKEMLIYKI